MSFTVTLPDTLQALAGTGVTLTPTTSLADESTATFQWYKNGEELTGSTEKSLSITSAEESDSGSYTVKVTFESESVTSAPCVLTVSNDDTPSQPVESDWYIHDLRPARDAGFTWIGWWVLDEIQKAQNEGFDWIADPTNERFKYQNVLVALSANKDTWADIEIQESRNGYILLLSSLI